MAEPTRNIEAAPLGTAARRRADWQLIALMAAIHCYSHFFIMGLPALFLFMQPALDVSFFALGWLATVFAVASGGAQFVMGILADRWGARRVLFGGMVLLAAGIAATGLSPWYWLMLPLAAAAGLGNSVFHPADYSILSHNVAPERLGRAFGMHQLGGSLGFAIGPLVTVFLASQIGWRMALVACGAVGLGLVALLLTQRHRLRVEITSTPAAGGAVATVAADFKAALPVILTAPILAMFLFYCFTGGISVAVTGSVPPALVQMFGSTAMAAAVAVAAFQFGAAAGTLAGGVLADRLRRFDLVAGMGYAGGAACMIVAATMGLAPVPLAALFFVAGFTIGTIPPSRDLMVRALVPKGQSGRVFGFVASGFDVGSAVLPPILGLMLDLGAPAGVFYVIVAVMLSAFAMATLAVRVRRPVAAG